MSADPHDLLAIQMQCLRDNEAWFPEQAHDLVHHILGLVGETGEFVEYVKKIERGSIELTPEVQVAMAFELVDILIYLSSIASIMNVDLALAYHEKRAQNVERFPVKGESNDND